MPGDVPEDILVKATLSGEQPPLLFILKSAESCAYNFGQQQENKRNSVSLDRFVLAVMSFKGSNRFGLKTS